jgi:hypothetical protein
MIDFNPGLFSTQKDKRRNGAAIYPGLFVRRRGGTRGGRQRGDSPPPAFTSGTEAGEVSVGSIPTSGTEEGGAR